jgi:hypothetical protein
MNVGTDALAVKTQVGGTSTPAASDAISTLRGGPAIVLRLRNGSATSDCQLRESYTQS